MMRIDNRRDILLLLLYSPGVGRTPNEPIIGRTRLVKALFLFKEEALQHFRKGTTITAENFYEFFPWDFGPFSTQVYDDLNFFRLHGFIEEETSDEEALPESAAEWEEWLRSSQPDSSEPAFSEYEEQLFKLTERGVNFTKSLFEALSPDQQRLLREFKVRIVKAPLRALLRYVYERYPSLIINSTIRDQVLSSK